MMKKLTTLILLIFTINGMAQTAIDNTFTYQGELIFNNLPANGDFDFKFVAYDVQDDSMGMALSTVTMDSPPITVTNGVFTAHIKFPDDIFMGDKIWLEINVQPATDTNNFQKLLPRQALNSTPYAIHAQFVGTIGANAVTGTEIVNESITNSELAPNSVNAINIINNSIGTNEIAADAVTFVELANDAVDTAAIQNGAITANKIGSNAVGTNEIVSSQVQRRISSSCDEGFYLSGINEDGSVQCKQLFGINSTIPDTGASQYSNNAISIRESGLPVIAYTSYVVATNYTLYLYDCTNVYCTSGTARALDNSTSPIEDIHVKLKSDGNPIISYYSGGDNALKIYNCTNSNCSSGTSRLLDTGSGENNSLAIQPISGFPVISYFDKTNFNMKIYTCNDVSCSSGIARNLVTNPSFYNTSIAINPTNDIPFIAYVDTANDYLNLYRCSNSGCTSGTIRTLDNSGNIGGNPSITFRPSSNKAIISYYDSVNKNLRIYSCQNTDCSSGQIYVINSLTSDGRYSNILIGETGLPIISFSSFNVGIKVLECATNTCFGGQYISIIDELGSGSNSMAIGTNGNPILSYFFEATTGIKVYSCSDRGCKK